MFDQVVFCLNQRRVAVLKQEIVVRPLARTREEEELIRQRAETENRLREVQEQTPAVIGQGLAEVRIPQLDTRILFRSQSVP